MHSLLLAATSKHPSAGVGKGAYENRGTHFGGPEIIGESYYLGVYFGSI